MAFPEDIDHILKKWAFDPFDLNVRLVQLQDREVIQMRIDMGLLQMETTDRPDGELVQGYPTFLNFLESELEDKGEEHQLSEDECVQVDREFVQFYHRRICWLQLKMFEKVVADADHSLRLMDLCNTCSPSEQWTLSHEQYRPFVLYHRTQAASLDVLDDTNGPELAIEEINKGLNQLREIFDSYDAEEQFEDDELVQRLTEFRENLRSRYEVGQTLEEKLLKAIEAEQYEQAAKIRDQLEDRNSF